MSTTSVVVWLLWGPNGLAGQETLLSVHVSREHAESARQRRAAASTEPDRHRVQSWYLNGQTETDRCVVLCPDEGAA